MCYTWRHDYGLDRKEHDGPGGLVTAGLTEAERIFLFRQMSQLYDNCIAPHIKEEKRWKIKVEENEGELVLPFPDDLLEELGWKEGDAIDWEVKDGAVYIKKL